MCVCVCVCLVVYSCVWLVVCLPGLLVYVCFFVCLVYVYLFLVYVLDDVVVSGGFLVRLCVCLFVSVFVCLFVSVFVCSLVCDTVSVTFIEFLRVFG